MPIFRQLPCLLTDEDILERGRQLANAEKALTDAEAERKAKNDEAKKVVNAIDGRIAELAAAIRDKVETRDVECVLNNNYDLMRKELIRQDTLEVVEHYEFTDVERQKEIPY